MMPVVDNPRQGVDLCIPIDDLVHQTGADSLRDVIKQIVSCTNPRRPALSMFKLPVARYKQIAMSPDTVIHKLAMVALGDIAGTARYAAANLSIDSTAWRHAQHPQASAVRNTRWNIHTTDTVE